MAPIISMVIKSIYIVVPYLVVLFVGVCAFTDAFQSIDQIVY